MSSTSEVLGSRNPFPSVVTDNIMSMLPLVDCVRMREIFRYGVEENLVHRKSLASYMSPFFSNIPTLIAAMTQSECAITGPRALEFFTPGFCKESDSWDFSVQMQGKVVDNMVAVLYMSGVEWNTKLFCLQRYILGVSDDPVVVDVDDLRRRALIPRDGYREMRTQSSDDIRALVLATDMLDVAAQQSLTQDDVVAVEFRKDHKGDIRTVVLNGVAEEERQSHNQDPMNYIQGYTTWRGTRVPVRICIHPINKYGLYELTYLGEAHATYLCCTLTPFRAIHLFYDHAVKKKGVWLVPRSHKFTHDDAGPLYLYKERGYEAWKDYEFPPKMMNLKNSSAISVPFRSAVDIYERSYDQKLILDHEVVVTRFTDHMPRWYISPTRNELVFVEAPEPEHSLRNVTLDMDRVSLTHSESCSKLCSAIVGNANTYVSLLNLIAYTNYGV